MVVAATKPYAYIANQGNSSITEIHTESYSTRQIHGNWKDLADLGWEPMNHSLIAISKNPPQIHKVPVAVGDRVAGRSVSLPGEPNRIALSDDGKFACISMTWQHAICLLELHDGRLQLESSPKVLPLTFQPKEILALDQGLFLVADAFGGQLVIVDAKQAVVTASHKILGHHIGGLARDVPTKSILLTHQKLSSVAQTNRDDVHWGTLMQNVVSIIPESTIIDPKANIARATERSMLGVVGNGAADPTGLASWDGQLFVAIAGTNKIAFRDKFKRQFLYATTEQPPTQLVRVGDNKILWISTLGDTACFMERVWDRLELRHTIGQAKSATSPEELGERAFFSGKLTHDGWMSCSSCHVNGHSPDLLADTRGDGSFENPKRIPSLLNVASTGPWAWNGSQHRMEEQIEKTLATTMHRDASDRQENGSDQEVAKNIAAYLRTLRLPVEKEVDSGEHRRGRSLFFDRGCNRCHQPELQYTTPDTYDVGVADEAGETKFNPPSLSGLRHRRAFLHDARYQSLEELLENHPNSKNAWNAEELADIRAFLMSL